MTSKTPSLFQEGIRFQDGTLQTTAAISGIPINAQAGTSYSFVDGDRGFLVTFSNTSAVAASLPQAGSGGLFLSGWFVHVENLNTGSVTITPTTSTINGWPQIVLAQYQSALIVSDGTNYDALFTKISSNAPASSLSGYVTNDAGTGASRNQIVLIDRGVTNANVNRKGLNIYMESNGANSGSNYDGLQVNVGASIDANTSGTVDQFEAAEFYMACSGTAVTLPQMNGIKVRTVVTGSAAVTNVTSILMYLPQFDAGTTTSNYTGIFLDSPADGGTVTNACGAMFQMNTGGITNTNSYGITAGGNSASIIADDSSATRSFIGHGPVLSGSMPFTLHDGWYGFTGSPEGVLSATVGSMYSRQDSTIGDCFYVKAAGSGNTEWSPVDSIGPIKTVSSTYSATNSDSTINANGTFIITLGSTGVPRGKWFYIKNIGTGVITVSSAVNIDGATSFTLPTQYQSANVQWDGTQWWIY